VSKKKNGTTLKRVATIVSITIGGLIILGAVGAVYVDMYKNEETCKRSLKNAEKNVKQDERLAEHETTIQVQNTKLDNIQNTLEKMDRKLDRALRR
jgi:uncharacterized protein HemX